jgi:putative Holliday junction resolvase
MGKIMALDVGSKTIGVALSDETETFAFPQKTIMRSEGYRRDMGLIRDLVRQEGVQEIVVGMPVSMSGEPGAQARKAAEFMDTLRRFVQVQVSAQDERLSTVEAERLLIQADRSRADRRRVIDSVAASLILQAYLDRRRSRTDT